MLHRASSCLAVLIVLLAATSVRIAAPLAGATSSTSVSQPQVVFSSTAGGASAVTYTIDFTLTNGIAAGGDVTVAGVPGTTFGGSGCLTDLTTPADSDSCVGGSTQNDSGSTTDLGATITFPVANTNLAGDAMELLVNGVTNPMASSQTITVSTSADSQPSASSSYAITPPTSVSQPHVSLSSTVGGASAVSYTITFTVTDAIAADGNVTIAGVPGTTFGGSGCLTDLTTVADSDSCVGGSTQNDSGSTTDNGATITFPVANTNLSGDSMSLLVNGVTNPTASSQTITVSTSADPDPSVSTGYALSGTATSATSVSSAALSVSSTAAGAAGVTYTVSFTTSSSGTLAGGASAINLVAPTGTAFPSCDHYDGCGSNNYKLVDATTGTGTAVPTQNQVNDDGSSMSIDVANTVAAGDSVVLTIAGVTNPSTGAGSLSVSTSRDINPVSVTDTTSGPQSVSAASFVESTSEAAADVTYEIRFTTSSTGELVGGESKINIVAPAGTVFPSCDHYDGCSSSDYQLVDNTTGTGTAVPAENQVNDDGSTMSVEVTNTISHGDNVTLTIIGVTNPPVSTGGITLSTSSDWTPTSPSVLASISGTVAYQGAPVAGAPVEACPTSGDGTCTTGSTDSSGAFFLVVAPTAGGTFSVTADPPAFGVDASPATLAPLVIPGPAGISGVAIDLQAPLTLSSGATIISPNFGVENSSTPTPTTYWDSPYQLELSPSLFPTGGAVVVTGVEIHGTNSVTGLPMVTTVNVGGSIGGNPMGEVLGTQPLDVTIPPLYPMHGAVSTTANYEFFPGLNIPAGVTTPPSGVAATQMLFETYPQQIGVPPTDPLPAYFTNYDDPPGVTLGPGSITGQDAQYFSVVPLTSYGVPAGTTNCGSMPAVLEQDDQTDQSTPPPSTSCGMAVQFTPPPQPQGDKILYYATLEAQIQAGAVTTTIPVLLIGCDSRVSQEASEVTYFDVCNNEGAGGPDQQYPAPYPPPDGSASSTGVGSNYVDPSGTVSAATPSGPGAPSRRHRYPVARCHLIGSICDRSEWQ